MKKTKPTRRPRQAALETGQLWRMADANLEVRLVGKFLIHCKLGKPNAIRIPSSWGNKDAVEKSLRRKKAVLA